jgi:hypothetical protein
MAKLPSGLPEHVADDEDLARFLTSSGHYNSTFIKHAAFMPNPKDGETSVFRHGANPVKELWKIGNANITNCTVHGAAIIKAKDVRRIKLTVFSHEPPPRHAAIRDWPVDNDPDIQKARRKELAMQLASVAARVINRDVSRAKRIAT